MGKLEHTLWVEKYRPDLLESYIGNKHLKTNKHIKNEKKSSSEKGFELIKRPQKDHFETIFRIAPMYLGQYLHFYPKNPQL